MAANQAGERLMQFRCEVYIRPRADILDPQGDAVNTALANLDFAGVSEVKVGKYLTLMLEADGAEAARTQLDEMCQKLLANPIIEDYEVEVQEA
jgi:phosphoribosylformylglycinamidine synthase PurS subunit